MIARLNGIVSEKFGETLYLDVSGVEYELAVTAADFGALAVGREARLYVYEQIREDAYNLFGFAELSAKQFFMLLLGVSGVGPKVAMAVLSATTVERLQAAIAGGDPDLLRGIAGVGRKTAERIIVELRSKLNGNGPLGAVPISDGTYQALLGLGYTQAQAANAVGQIPADITSEQERIKAALKVLAK